MTFGFDELFQMHRIIMPANIDLAYHQGEYTEEKKLSMPHTVSFHCDTEKEICMCRSHTSARLGIFRYQL